MEGVGEQSGAVDDLSRGSVVICKRCYLGSQRVLFFKVATYVYAETTSRKHAD